MDIDIQKIAKLSRLQISPQEEKKFQKEMSDILHMVEHLPDIAEGDFGVDPSHPMQLRKDIAVEKQNREEILQNAPQKEAGCFVVPRVVE